MRCYRLPGFQSRLLLELQRQQNNTLFCDTLLQTEGVSVPAHGCVLAALSPYLSCILSASPQPPAGQQRKVKLQAVNAQTLLKLVGLLYSGLLEVNELTDRDDVLAAANRLGFDHLVEGQEVVRGAGQAISWEALQLAEERKDREKRVTCDAEVQVETRRRRDAETQIEGTGSVDAASQTARAQSGVWHSWSSRDDASLRGELGPGSPTALLHEAGLSKGVTKTGTTKSPRSTRVSSELSYHIRPKPASLKGNHWKTRSRGTAGGGGKKQTSGGQSTQMKGKEIRKRRARMGGGSWSPKRLSAETREIATKVKLRKVQQGTGWEVVNMQDMDQRRSLRRRQGIFAALKKDRAKLLRTQAEGTKGPSAASTSQPSPVTKQHKSSCMSLGLTVQPPRTEVFTDLQSPSSPYCTKESNDSMATLLSQGQCSVEETDQEIEKLLEDVMMCLNILPSSGLEKDGNRSSFKSNSAAIPSTPPALEWTVRQGEVDTAASVVGSQGYKMLWEDASSKDASPKDTVLHSKSSFCLVPVAASTASVHCAETWPQTERQSNQIAQAQSSLAQEQPASKDSSPNEIFSQCHSLNHRGQGDTTDQSALCSEPLDYQDRHTLNVASIAPDTVNSDSQQTDQPASKELTWMSSTLHALQFPLNSGSKEETKPSEPEDPSRLESMEDLELLQSLRQSTEVMQEKRKPPVKTVCVKAAKEKMQSSDREGLTGAISPFGKASKRKDPPLKQCDTKDKPVTSKRKRKCEAHTDDASDRTLGYKVTRHGAGEFSKIFLNVCSVSLSCNNVLSKRRILKQEPPVFKEPQKVLDTTAVDKGSEKLKADKTITETRKRSTPRARSASTTKDKADEIVETVPVIKWKVGRPPKIKTVPHDANPSIDKIVESDRKTNALAEIGEQCGQNEGKLRRKCREIVQDVPISNNEKDKADEIVETVPVIKWKVGRPPKIKTVPHNANPSIGKILESDRKTNALAEIGEQCGQNERKLRRKCREIVQDVPILNNEKDKADEIVETVPVIKWKVGRPPKIKTVPHDANPSIGKILESDRKTNALAEIREQCGQNKGKLRRKCREIVQDVPISNNEKDKADEIVETVPLIKWKVGRPPKIKTVPHDANPSIDKILESDRKTNALAEIGEQCGQNKGKLRRKCREIVQDVQISNDEVHDDVPSSDTVSAPEPPRVADEQLCTQPHDPSESEPNEHRAGSENTQTEEGKMTGTPESRRPQLLTSFYNDVNKVDVVVKASPSQSSSIASKVGDQCIAQHPGHSAASDTNGKPDTIQPRPTVEPVMGLKKSDNERWVEADDLSSKDIGFHSNKGEETRGVEIEEMGEALLDGDERLVERPDEASDSANSTETPQAPVGTIPYWVRPSQQSNVTTTYCSLPSEPQNRRSPDIEGSRHSQEDEMEVDILLCSPDKGRRPMEFGGRVIVDTSEDEDEEELEEIDVMGI